MVQAGQSVGNLTQEQKLSDIVEIVTNTARDVQAGKKVGNSLYIARMVLPQECLIALKDFYSSFCLESYNVIKVSSGKKKKISFLYYSFLMDDFHPELQRSFCFQAGVFCLGQDFRVYRKNRPILHRKELLFFRPTKDKPEPSNPHLLSLWKKWTERTALEEKFGLYENTRIIGHKDQWLKLCEEKGFNLKM